MTELFPNPSHTYLGTFVVSQLQQLRQEHDITVLVPYFLPLKQLFRQPTFPVFPGLKVVYLPLPTADLFLRHQFGFLSHERLFLALKRRAARAVLKRATELHHQQPFTLVHGHEAFIGDEATTIGEHLGIPSIVTIHSLYEYRLQQVGQLAMSVILKHLAAASHLIAVSHRALDSYAAHGGTPAHTSVIANGVDTATQVASLRKQFQIAPEDLCFLSVGSFTPEKRFTFAIETLAQARQHGFPTAQLFLVGRGAEEQRLRSLATELNVQSAVHFMGEVPPKDMGALYSSANILLHPSVVDSFSMVCLEAMSYGLPVVCSDAIGLTEFVQANKEIILVPADNLQQFANAAIALAGDSTKRAAIGQAARRRAESMSWVHQSKLIAELYNTYARVQ